MTAHLTLESSRPFDAIVRENEPALQGFAARLCRTNADAGDLVQDTFERALRGFPAFVPGTNARAWLFTILHRTFLKRERRAASERRFGCLDDLDVPAPEPTLPPAWADLSSEHLSAAMALLEEEFRTPYRMHSVESLSYAEISFRLGVPVSTVGTRLRRARQKLRALLEVHVAKKSHERREDSAESGL
jgi:RNA polymerase sigma-70 factor (ECF subfamily)